MKSTNIQPERRRRGFQLATLVSKLSRNNGKTSTRRNVEAVGLAQHFLRIVPRSVAVALALSLGLLAQTAEPTRSGEKAVRATTSPGVETLTPLETFPNAVCSLATPDTSGEPVTHKYYADEAGVVRLYVTAPGETLQHLNVTFLCSAGDQSESIAVELRANSTPTIDMPAPRADFADRALQQLGTPRPALAGDPALIPQDELIRMGYPPRPDPVTEPVAFETWLRLAAQPVRIIQNKLPLPLHNERFDINSQSWAGFALEQPYCNWFILCDIFEHIEGAWNVPKVYNDPGVTRDGTLGVWVGLDGGGTASKDILQTGTGSRASQTCIYSTICWGFTAYWTWTEWFPNGPTNNPVQVNPGDEIFAEAWYPGSGRTGYLYLQNLTQGTARTLPEPMPSTVSYFSGDSAEWIMERQPGPLPHFSNWGDRPTLSWAYVQGAGCPCTLDGNTPFVRYDMYNWGRLLTYPILTSSTSMYWVYVQSQ